MFLNVVVKRDLRWFVEWVERLRGVFMMKVLDWGIGDADLHIWVDTSGHDMDIWCGEDELDL